MAYSRQFYNDSILSYNNMVEKFPGNIFAAMYGKKKKKFFEIAEADKKLPKVSF